MPSSQPFTTRAPGDTIAYGPAGPITVEQFLGEAAALAAALPECRYIINLAADRYRFLLGFAAAIIAGQCTLMPPNRQPQSVRQLADDYADSYTYGETGVDGVEHLDSAASLTAVAAGVPEIPDDRLCAIVFTSGSTGAPSPNFKYWTTLRTGTLSNVALLTGAAHPYSAVVATVPPQHMWGFETSILLPLFCDLAVSHRTPFFPQDIADALAALPEPRVLVSSPVHLGAFLDAVTDRIRIATILSATAPMSRMLAAQLEERFDARVIDVFGSSESGIIARRNTATETLWQLSPTFELHIGDDGTRISAAHLPGDVIMQDIVEVAADHRFRWLGRQQDMINIAGKRGSLADLNQRLTAIPGVVDGVIFLPDEASKRLAALVVAPELTPSDILERLRPGIEPAFLPRPIYIVPSLPRQETGKLARTTLVQLFADTRKARTQHDDDARESD